MSWKHENTICKICNHEWVAVFPVGTDESQLECPKCGAMHTCIVGANV